MNSIWLNRFAKLLTFLTLVLILAGGLVTSTGSGLSVPDWPLSYGTLNPPMIGGIRFEHSHRLIAGTIGILTLILMVWTLKVEKRAWVRRFSIGAFAAVVAQAVLGGLTVIYLLPTPISIFHACLGQTFFCLIVAFTIFTSREWRKVSPLDSEQAGRLRRILGSTLFFIYLQLVLGAVVRHAEGAGIAFHIINAFLVLIHVGLSWNFISHHYPDEPRFARPAACLGILAAVQFFLGLGSFIFVYRISPGEQMSAGRVMFTAAHQTLGAVILATTLVLLIRSYRFLKPVPAPVGETAPVELP